MPAAALEAFRKGTPPATSSAYMLTAADGAGNTVGSSDGSSAAAAMMLMTDMPTMDLDTLRRTVQLQQSRDLPAPPRPIIRRVPEVTDDFVRNFLLRNGMRRTLDIFEVEWYEHLGAGVAAGGGGGGLSAASAVSTAPLVPDNYLESTALLNRVEVLEHDLRQHAELTTKLTKQWVQAKKDRDYHRASHNRVVQEKNRLERLLQQAHNQAEDISPALTDLRQRCETLFKAKTLVSIEKDRFEQKVAQLEKRVEELQQLAVAQGEGLDGTANNNANNASSGNGAAAKKTKSKKGKAAETAATTTTTGSEAAGAAFSWPADERPRAPMDKKTSAALRLDVDPTAWTCQEHFLAHTQAVTSLALHPFKPAVATGSDDGGWRVSALPQGEAILTAQGHANWVSSVAFHPTGTVVATGSGDKSIKLWSLASNACSASLLGHTDGVWALDFQETGVLLASSGLDQTARVWDIEGARCLRTLRGHVEAVNAVRWQPNTNVLCTASGDKTVSLWDTRMSCCSQSLYGHRTAVLSVAPTPATAATAGGSGGGSGSQLQIFSSDAEGVVKVWDLRMMQPRLSFNVNAVEHSRPAGRQSGNTNKSNSAAGGAISAANHVAIDASGAFIAVTSDDGGVKMIDLAEETVTELGGMNGHEDAVLCAAFDPSTNAFLVSCGADRTVRYWC